MEHQLVRMERRAGLAMQNRYQLVVQVVHELGGQGVAAATCLVPWLQQKFSNTHLKHIYPSVIIQCYQTTKESVLEIYVFGIEADPDCDR